MRSLRVVLLAMLLAAPFRATTMAQVVVGVGIGPAIVAKAFVATFWLLCGFHVTAVFAAARIPLRVKHKARSVKVELPQQLESLTE